MKMYTLLCIACIIWTVDSYGNGMVPESCTDMVPRHPGNAQTTSSPYTVTSNMTSYKAGDAIKVTLQASSTAFIGFMLQAREVGGSVPVGSFTITNTGTQRLNCNGVSNSAVTHTSAASKTNVQALWTAPSSGSLKDIEFRATFVQRTNTYWVQVKSSKVIFSGQPGPNPTAVVQPSTSVGVSSSGCGSTKVCFSEPSGCDPAADANCHFMAVSTSPAASTMQLELSGPSDGYIATGFSDDQEMGNDDIYICGLNSNSAVQVQHAYSTGRSAPEILSLENVTDIKTSVLNGIISCSFTSQNPIKTQRSLSSSPYYLMFVYGPSNNGQIQIHTETYVSGKSLDITSPQTVSPSLPSIIKAHGALMLIAWMTTGSLGMLIARYMKSATRGTTCCNKDLWFLAHVFLMALSVAATIIAFILIFSYAGDWAGGAHPVLGCLVMILAFVQPFAALFRCTPDHKWRYIFNWTHALNALTIKVLAVGAIFTGLALIDTTADMWIQKVMGGFVGWEVLLFILQHANFKRSQNDGERASQVVKVEVGLLILFLIGNLVFLVAILVGIGMS
ncbi:putative ferric-chelate reductase 1 [Anguilla rostrata]|uniref:putative ferric-chelate reductase 1 n=1 Tax=Anguilla rostrata TaxID=7938 RepID=UPI0030D29AAB